MSKVLALNVDGKLTYCSAPEEERGKGRCNHVAHQLANESVEEFKSRINSKIVEDSNKKKIGILAPYRMEEDEKKYLDEIRGRKQLEDEDCEGGYIELPEPLWNDMDKRYFSEISDIKVGEINKILKEESYIVFWVSSKVESPQIKVGLVVNKDKKEKLQNLYPNLISFKTGVVGLNEYASTYEDFEATKDVYVLPYYMRQDPPLGESKHPLNVLYNKLIIKRKDPKAQQLAYEQLLDNKNVDIQASQKNGYAISSLADEFKGKSGLLRGIMTGRKICYSARGVLNMDSKMEYGNVKIPASAICDIFKPSITEKLKNDGYSNEQVNAFFDRFKFSDKNKIKAEDRRELENIVKGLDRKVLINRQPSLHQSSLLAMSPMVSEDNTIRLSPQFFAGIGGDLDGDTLSIYAINDKHISQIADKELGPYSTQAQKLPRHLETNINLPSKDALWGLLNVISQRKN